MQANEGVTIELLQILSMVQSLVMSNLSVWWFLLLLLLVLVSFVVGLEGFGCPNHCFCYLWGGLVRTDCIGKNLFNTFIGTSHQTQVLDLSYNVISILHGNEFLDANLRHLQDLRLSNNEIHKIDKLSFNGLQLLQNLDLSFNSIEYLNPMTFKYNSNLRTLNVSFNPLNFKKDEPFLSSPIYLQTLDIAECQVEFVTARSFTDLKNLKVLNISRNYIRLIELEFLEEMKSLKYLDVSKNDFPCNDQTNVLLKTLEELKIQFQTFCQTSQKMFMIPVIETEEKDSLKMELYQEDYINNVTQKNPHKKDFFDGVSTFFKSIPSFYAIVCGLQIGILIGSFSTYLCLKKSYKNQSFNINHERAAGESTMGLGNGEETDNFGFALIPLQTPPGTPPSPYHSRFFSSNFSLSAT